MDKIIADYVDNLVLFRTLYQKQLGPLMSIGFLMSHR
ncbi:Uncharacterised protein [Salmonella enterica subsp. enterica]|uniref:Uncharacterized protein n=1 Tax=Salmonella enterica I TaxID=59201 RepID=A0A379VP90_SALET|nr:Uncharacterised protein [Salmonella enterica subsp. enterica]